MRKWSAFWLGYLCLALITACVQKDEPLGPKPGTTSGEVGAAQLRLPAIPPGFLAKRTLGPRDTLGPIDSAGPIDTIDSPSVYFILTISGPGMTPRRLSWPLDTASTTVTVENIPVGSRLFTGELALGGDVRYADSAWAYIEAGKTAFVHLRLGAATGSAEICVEIEGLPAPAGCRPDPGIPDVSGCWYFLAGDSLAPDTAHLRLTQFDSTLIAVLDFGGHRDSTYGRVYPGGWVGIGTDSSASFVLTLMLDSTGTFMTGRFIHRSGTEFTAQFVQVLRMGCPVVPVPTDSLTCWEATQRLGRDTTLGRYLMLERGSQVFGLFRWSNFPQMPMRGFKSPLSVPMGAAPMGLYLYGTFPPGMNPSPPRRGVDSAHYKGQIAPDAPSRIGLGSVNGLDTAGRFVNLGEWHAARGTCSSVDLRAVRAAHGL